MKVIIAGSRDCHDYNMVKSAVEKSGFEITEVVSGTAKGVDKLGERWAKENDIPVKEFPARWKAINRKGAVVKKNKWGKYDAKAGTYRNEQMAKYADALIAINQGTPGTLNMIKQAREQELDIYVYDPYEEGDMEYDYEF